MLCWVWVFLLRVSCNPHQFETTLYPTECFNIFTGIDYTLPDQMLAHDLGDLGVRLVGGLQRDAAIII